MKMVYLKMYQHCIWVVYSVINIQIKGKGQRKYNNRKADDAEDTESSLTYIYICLL